MLWLLCMAVVSAADKNFTVSGLSSGAFMTVQLHVAFSSYITGAAVVAGGPFYCTQGKISNTLSICTTAGELINIQGLIQFANLSSELGYIDDVSNLYNDKVWIFSGTSDNVVAASVVSNTVKFYQSFVNSSLIYQNFTTNAEHAWITDNYGSNCTYLGPPYINNCGFDMAEQILTYLIGNLTNKTTAIEANLKTFSQVPYANGAGMAPLGYIYIPTNCQDQDCTLHVSFHGCNQNYECMGSSYVSNIGLNEWAESNDIVVLYPQTKTDNAKNSGSCWDFWGYTDEFYWSNKGKQTSAVWSMTQNITKIISQSNTQIIKSS